MHCTSHKTETPTAGRATTKSTPTMAMDDDKNDLSRCSTRQLSVYHDDYTSARALSCWSALEQSVQDDDYTSGRAPSCYAPSSFLFIMMTILQPTRALSACCTMLDGIRAGRGLISVLFTNRNEREA
jgi:hypothetical protein